MYGCGVQMGGRPFATQGHRLPERLRQREMDIGIIPVKGLPGRRPDAKRWPGTAGREIKQPIHFPEAPGIFPAARLPVGSRHRELPISLHAARLKA